MSSLQVVHMDNSFKSETGLKPVQLLMRPMVMSSAPGAVLYFPHISCTWSCLEDSLSESTAHIWAYGPCWDVLVYWYFLGAQEVIFVNFVNFVNFVSFQL